MEKYFISLLSDDKIIRHHFVHTNQLIYLISTVYLQCLCIYNIIFYTKTQPKYESPIILILIILIQF